MFLTFSTSQSDSTSQGYKHIYYCKKQIFHHLKDKKDFSQESNVLHENKDFPEKIKNSNEKTISTYFRFFKQKMNCLIRLKIKLCEQTNVNVALTRNLL